MRRKEWSLTEMEKTEDGLEEHELNFGNVRFYMFVYIQVEMWRRIKGV
jgi:hypothetical protein